MECFPKPASPVQADPNDATAESQPHTPFIRCSLSLEQHCLFPPGVGASSLQRYWSKTLWLPRVEERNSHLDDPSWGLAVIQLPFYYMGRAY